MELPKGVEITAPIPKGLEPVLSPEALAFVLDLHGRFGERRRQLLGVRKSVQARLDSGWNPDFLAETAAVRRADWKIAPVPAGLQDRRVEITGPVERKMIINALNSGAKVFMADFEDSHSPTWTGTLQGQSNLFDAVRGTIEYRSPEGKEYRLASKVAALMVRPRGWHLEEKHLRVNGESVSASLFDFGLFFFHNAAELVRRGSGPYLYLPKMESHLEARLWNDVFVFSQQKLGLVLGTIKATVLIETILAAFEMDEILHELKDHSAGLNCGRWDYIFSFIKKFAGRADRVLPDRARVTMQEHFLKSYTELLIQTCHRRGAHAMGGMAAQIPIKEDPEANRTAIGKVVADKEREVRAGHDGTWVAHPALVAVAREVFDQHMKGPNQLAVMREDVRVTAGDLLRVPEGPISEAGLRSNVRVGVQYLEAWLRGSGCVPLYHLMEDAATAEISRAQIWQWIRHPGGVLEDGRRITADLFRAVLRAELQALRQKLGPAVYDQGWFVAAAEIFERISTAPEFPEFLTLAAYPFLEG